MGFIVPAIVLILILLAAVAASIFLPKKATARSRDYPYDNVETKNKNRTIAQLVAAGALVALIVLTAACAFARVGAREVAVETSFGKYSRTLDAGWQTKAPWADIETFSTQLQRSEIDSPVAFEGGGGGTQHSTVQWSVTGDEAESLWSRYKTFENVSVMLIEPSTRQAVGDVLAKYSPAEARADGNGPKIREEIEASLAERLAEYGVDLDSVQMPPSALDQTAQDALNRVVEAEAEVDRAKAREEQAIIDARADKARNAEVKEENLILECLTVTRTWNDDANGPLPASWSCIGGDSVPLVKPVN